MYTVYLLSDENDLIGHCAFSKHFKIESHYIIATALKCMRLMLILSFLYSSL